MQRERLSDEDRDPLPQSETLFDHPDFDAVIARIGASTTDYGTAAVRQFEMIGVYCVNESVAITRARYKLRSMQLLSRKCVGTPVTAFANRPDDIEQNARMDKNQTKGKG